MVDMDKEINEVFRNNNELGGFKVSQLKKYLTDRHLNVSGKKCELVLPIKGAHKLSIVDKDSLAKVDIREKTEAEKQSFVLPSFCYTKNGCVKLKMSHRYFHQVQGQIGVSDKTWCDFVVWHMLDLVSSELNLMQKCGRICVRSWKHSTSSPFYPNCIQGV